VNKEVQLPKDPCPYPFLEWRYRRGCRKSLLKGLGVFKMIALAPFLYYPLDPSMLRLSFVTEIVYITPGNTPY
jgi:hypothetical protein